MDRRLFFTTTLSIALSPGFALAQSLTAFKDHTVRRGGATLLYRDIGSGPAVVMIPSAGRSTHDFDELAKRVAMAGYRVILAETRGAGGSTGPLDGLTLADYARDILAIMDDAGVKKAVILAHAAGARDARVAIGLAPGRFEKLISLGTGAGGGASVRAGIDPAEAEQAHKRIPLEGVASDAQRLKDLQLLYFASGSDASIWLQGWSPEASDAHAAAARRTPKADWWPGRPIPSLIIEAADDAIAPPEGQALVKVLGPDVVVLSLPHAGHAMLPEQPDAVAAVVIAYLKGRAGLQAVIDRHIRIPPNAAIKTVSETGLK